MADEDTVLEEAMDNLKEAGQRIRATQSLMRSQGMTDGENHRDPFYGARHDRSGIPRGKASEGSLIPVAPLSSLVQSTPPSGTAWRPRTRRQRRRWWRRAGGWG